MSRLKRDIARRDKAFQIMQQIESGLEEQCPLDLEKKLTLILKDIPSHRIKLPEKKLSKEWETIAIVYRIASLAELHDKPVLSIDEYIYKNRNHKWLTSFREKWRSHREDSGQTYKDFLKELDFNLEFSV
jgi:hypothetical protein